MKSPLYAKQRLERLLSKTNDARRQYQTRLADEGNISDKDFNRSLSEPETTLVHNAWMNDVSAWMNEKCLDQYTELLSQESTKGKGQGSAGKPASRALFMSFVRHPCLQTPDGFGLRLTELEEYKTSVAYPEMVKQSELAKNVGRRGTGT